MAATAPARPGTASPQVGARALVVVAAAGLVASYLVTWDLWRERSVPPNLPVVEGLSSLWFGPALVLTALAAALLPRPGATAHGALLVLAVLGDQVRLQPEFISLAILLLAGAWPPKGVAVGRWHVITLWGWAGLHKILSRGWPTGGAAFIADALGASGLRPLVALVFPLVEIGLAVLALRPSTWRILRIAAPAFHLGGFVTLAVAGANSAVWPWNIALAAAAPLLFRSSPSRDEAATSRSTLSIVAAAAFAIYPAGFYVGVSDAYLSHNLYSSNTAQASVCAPGRSPACAPAPFSTWERLNVPLPPERRLYLAWYREICQPGQELRIDGRWTHLHDRRVEYVRCTRTT